MSPLIEYPLGVFNGSARLKGVVFISIEYLLQFDLMPQCNGLKS